jgi:hypothetical protein
MRKLALILISAAATCAAAQAADLSIKFSNKTGVAINIITATPKAGGAVITVSATAIAAGAEPKLTITPPANTCLFSMTYTLASGRIIANSETDLCQTDQIIVE